MRQLPLDVRLPENAGFAAFVPGRNAEVVAAVRRHALRRADPVLWLRGPAGVGKTHLLRAACNAVRDSGEAAPFVAAADLDASDDAWRQRAAAAMVAVDDIDRVANDGAMQRKLFALFNSLRDRGSTMLVAARPGPREVGFTLPDLASRLVSGPVYKLESLTDDQRLAALTARAQLRGFELPPAVGRYLMQRVPRDLSSLLALLDRLDSASLSAQRRLTIPFVRDILRRAAGDSEDVED